MKLLDASIAPNTAAAYRAAINCFKEFLLQFNLKTSWPTEAQHIVLFISFCFEKGLAPNTISTYVAGVNHVHKMHGGEDLRETFIIKKMLEGCTRLRKRNDTRLPITIKLLNDVCNILPTVCYNQFEVKLFKAAYLLAFFGLLRVSEIVVPSSILANRTLAYEDVSFSPGNKHILLTLRISKTNQSGHPETLKIPCEENSLLCPVTACRDFLLVRPVSRGPFFCHADAAPLTRCQFSAVLAKCLKCILPGCRNIKSHSFRIGRATHLYSLGVSGDVIKTLGRWRSDAYKKYIRN